MTFHPPYDQRLAFVIRQDATQIAMQFLSQRLLAEKRPAVFGGENRVNEDFGERLGHVIQLLQS